jgi:mitochondrial fission protein ELM1
VGQGEFKVWCLLGRKAGDNTQVRALAEELGYGYEEKHILARPWELFTHVTLQVTLTGIDQGSRSQLSAPWPDLVISAGRRNEPVARWIRRQSGGVTRLVQIGRPWAALDNYDLIVSTPQYFLPERDNIHTVGLPLSRWLPVSLESAAAELRASIEHLPRPWIAVLVGGNSGKFVFTPEKGERLGLAAVALAVGQGGSLLVTDSPRTPRAAGDALQGRLRETDYCCRWGEPGTNPYLGLLALADAFVVTGESMSMLGEAVATNKPLHIFDISDAGQPWWRRLHNCRYKPLSHHLAMHLAPRRMRRDVGRIQEALVNSGRAIWLEDAGDNYLPIPLSGIEPGQANSLSQLQELQAAAQRVRRLLTPG